MARLLHSDISLRCVFVPKEKPMVGKKSTGIGTSFTSWRSFLLCLQVSNHSEDGVHSFETLQNLWLCRYTSLHLHRSQSSKIGTTPQHCCPLHLFLPFFWSSEALCSLLPTTPYSGPFLGGQEDSCS